MNGSGIGPHDGIDSRRRGPLLALGGVGLSVILIAVAVWSSGPVNPSPNPTPQSTQSTSIALPSTPPAASAPTPTPVPTMPLDPSAPWGELVVPAIEAVATLAATKMARNGVAADTAFTLVGVGAEDPLALAQALEVTPALELAVSAGPAERTITLRPATPLRPGQLYRFTLRAPDGTISGSWAFQAQSPLRVVTTLPYNQATDVPETTGVEFTFDQDGAVDAASHFSIEPEVKGRFEQHGRTFVFVPERLKPATLYTATLGRGVRLEGSDLALEDDVVVRFETALATDATQPSASYQFSSTMEWRPGERPITTVWISSSSPDNQVQQAVAKRPFRVTVYRLASERAGVDAIRVLTEAPDWARRSARSVATTGLARVMSFDATPQGDPNSGQWIRFPAALERGWYLVDAPRPLCQDSVRRPASSDY